MTAIAVTSLTSLSLTLSQHVQALTGCHNEPDFRVLIRLIQSTTDQIRVTSEIIAECVAQSHTASVTVVPVECASDQLTAPGLTMPAFSVPSTTQLSTDEWVYEDIPADMEPTDSLTQTPVEVSPVVRVVRKPLKHVVIDPNLRDMLLVNPGTRFFVNRQYIKTTFASSHRDFHSIMAWVFSHVRKVDGSTYNLMNKAKYCPSIVIQALIYIQRPAHYRENEWLPYSNPVFLSDADLNLFIQRHKLLIIHFYHFICTGRQSGGEYLLERKLDIISDRELSSPYAHRFLLRDWKDILDYST